MVKFIFLTFFENEINSINTKNRTFVKKETIITKLCQVYIFTCHFVKLVVYIAIFIPPHAATKPKRVSMPCA